MSDYGITNNNGGRGALQVKWSVPNDGFTGQLHSDT